MFACTNTQCDPKLSFRVDWKVHKEQNHRQTNRVHVQPGEIQLKQQGASFRQRQQPLVGQRVVVDHLQHPELRAQGRNVRLCFGGVVVGRRWARGVLQLPMR